MCTDGGAFRIVEATFRTDQQGSGAFGIAKGIGSRFAAFLVGEEQVPFLRPVTQQRVELRDGSDLGQRRTGALFGRFCDDRIGTLAA